MTKTMEVRVAERKLSESLVGVMANPVEAAAQLERSIEVSGGVAIVRCRRGLRSLRSLLEELGARAEARGPLSIHVLTEYVTMGLCQADRDAEAAVITAGPVGFAEPFPIRDEPDRIGAWWRLGLDGVELESASLSDFEDLQEPVRPRAAWVPKRKRKPVPAKAVAANDDAEGGDPRPGRLSSLESAAADRCDEAA